MSGGGANMGGGGHRSSGHHRMHYGAWAFGIFLGAWRHGRQHHHRLAQQRRAQRFAHLDAKQAIATAAIADWFGRIVMIIFVLYLAWALAVGG